MNKQSTIFLNGAPGSGKSTLAQAYAETLPKSVVLDADFFKHQIVGGKIRLQRENPEEFSAQRNLAAQCVIEQTKLFYNAGYTVIIVSMAHVQSVLDVYFPALDEISAVKKILLTPSKEILYVRDKERPEFKHTPKEALDEFWDIFQQKEFDDWKRLDTTNEAVGESIESIKKVIN